MKKYLINPFEYVTESRLLLTGLCITIAGSVLAYFGTGRYDGVIDFHYDDNVLPYQPFLDNGINIFSLFITLYICGLLINKKSRAIDILNTALIARSPLYLLPFAGIWEYNRSIEEKLLQSLKASPAMSIPDLTVAEYTVIILVAILGLCCIIWFIILLYKGFKTATNVKEVSHKVYFAIAIVLSEIISKILFSATN